jgi:thiol-disulfide isomerase/thioredoxin
MLSQIECRPVVSFTYKVDILQKKHTWLRRGAEVLIILMIFLAVHAWQTRHAPSGPAPAISGVLLDGSSVSLDQYRGKPMLLHFWATWCPICNMEQKSIAALADDYPVLTIAMDEASAQEIREYMKNKNVDYPVLHDPQGVIAKRYSIAGVPSSFVIGPEGEVRFVEVGYTTGFGLRFRLWWAGF